jgi:proteasome beta subunit
MDESKLRKTGTTTVGVICQDAVVLGAEKKATMGYLVATKAAEKIMQLDEHVGMTIAGLEGDAQALARYIKAEMKLYKLQEERKIPVKAAANLISNILYSRRGFPYIVQLVVGGYDSKPRLFSFDPSGSITEEKEYFSTGSGSPMAFGVLEDKYRPGMTVEQAKTVVAKAIKSAMERDIASGGKGIDLAVIDSRGFKAIRHEDVSKMIK